jgi:hypothetical protein
MKFPGHRSNNSFKPNPLRGFFKVSGCGYYFRLTALALRVGLIQALDHMSKFTVCALLLLAVGSVSARERPIFSCDKAPLLVEYKKQLPDHILAASADTKPEPQSKLPRTAVPILERARSNLVCVVIALDATGKAEDLAVSYPAGFKLTDKEREQILLLQWSAAQLGGRMRPSLVNMDFAYR